MVGVCEIQRVIINFGLPRRDFSFFRILLATRISSAVIFLVLDILEVIITFDYRTEDLSTEVGDAQALRTFID